MLPQSVMCQSTGGAILSSKREKKIRFAFVFLLKFCVWCYTINLNMFEVCIQLPRAIVEQTTFANQQQVTAKHSAKKATAHWHSIEFTQKLKFKAYRNADQRWRLG
ncbi:Uncharacterized protein APZ42_023296 [Daphnia magna]|uniref:Uncharacterized protein n=1 Tax=Daphnia magna TaxID=35525 RepID=A0A0P6CDV3_9CRUS|nr:Uncharacterized protein APZ42_023296 [Daphnia magna]